MPNNQNTKSKTVFTKRDVIITLTSLAFLLANLAAIGAAGRRRAKEAICLSNLHQWGVIWQLYADDNEGSTLPDLAWERILKPYHKNTKILLCPAASTLSTSPPGGGWAGVIGGKFTAWGRDYRDGRIYGSYGMNDWATHVRGVTGGRIPSYLWSTFYVKDAADVPVLLDCAVRSATPLHTDVPPEYDGQIYYGGTNVDEIRGFCIDRHSGGVNGLFLDLATRKVGLKELWKIRWHRDWFGELSGRPNHWPPAWPAWMQKFKDY